MHLDRASRTDWGIAPPCPIHLLGFLIKHQEGMSYRNMNEPQTVAPLPSPTMSCCPPSLLTFYFLCALTVPKIICNWRWAGGNNACNSRCESWDPPLYSLLLGGVSNSITFTLDLATSILSHLVAMATWPRWYLHQDDDRVNMLCAEEERLYYNII